MNKLKKIKYIVMLIVLFILFSYKPTEPTLARYKFAVQLKADMEQEVQEIVYDITYVLNGGTQGENAPTKIGENEQVQLPIPTKENCEFLGWYDNMSFNGDAITTLSNVEDDITLYAKWNNEKPKITYVFGDNIDFDGITYIDTDIALFTEKEINRDFEITVNIDENIYLTGQTGGYNTFMNCADHNTSPYHGFNIRRNANNIYFKITTAATTVSENKYTPGTIQNIRLVRTDKKLYAEINNSSNLEQVGDYSNLTKYFNSTLLFGTDMQGSGIPFRYFKGKMSNITVTNIYDTSEFPITLPNPTLTDHKFEGWYRDEEFTSKIGEGGDSYEVTDSIVLYAKWHGLGNSEVESEEEYNYDGEYSFSENDYINTHMYLYKKQNIFRDFEMSFNIVDLNNSNNYATLMSATRNILRIADTNKQNMNFLTHGNTTKSVNNIPNTITNVRILRINNILYYSFNGHDFLKINNYANSAKYSDLPLIFGADYDQKGEIYREFDGTLSDIHVKFIDEDVSIEDYSRTKGELKVAYEQVEPYVFDGTNYIDTSIKLFDFDNYDKDFEISFNIDSVADDNEEQSTIVNAKYEVSPYPGFVYRLTKEKKLEFTAAGASGTANLREIPEVQTVKISRRNLKIYLQINDEEEILCYDFSTFVNFMNTSLTIGSSLDGNGNPFRYFKGTLSNIVIKVEE